MLRLELDCISKNLFRDSIKIEKFAFRECNNISQVELPQSVKELGAGAFASCYELKKINLPENLEIIGEACFADCKLKGAWNKWMN